MHLQVNEITTGKRTFRYVRIVRAYRKNGVPTKKVLANLGDLPPQMIENLRAALAAAREGKAVVLEQATAVSLDAAATVANFAYLDAAACLEIWNQWGFTPLLDQLLRERRRDEVSPGSVLAILTLHRCLEPDSKHKAVSWFENTALPELLGISPDQFNNSRVHRVLSALDVAIDPLQGSLSRAFQRLRGNAQFAMFLDVTDAWFVGRGCSLAERGRTKEGLRNRRKIGVVLLCDDSGFPLRWDVVEGKRADHLVMGDLITTIQDCSWVGDKPIVCDRAMGKASSVGELLRSGLHFLTAVPRNEIETHTTAIPYQILADFEPEAQHTPSDDEVTDVDAARTSYEKDVARVRELARKAGLQEVDPTLFVLDLGLGVRPLDDLEPQWVGPEDIDPERLTGAASALAWARIFQRMLRTGECKHQAALARRTGISRARVTEVMNLLRLDPQVQEELLAGEYGPISDHPLRAVVKLSGAEAQRAALRAYAATQAQEQTSRVFRPRRLRTTETHQLRRVVYFNPDICVWKRLRERRKRARLDDFIRELNERLRAPRCRKDDHDIRFEVTERLSDEGVLSLYAFTVDQRQDAQTGAEYWQVTLTPHEERWRRHRRYNGFVLLVSHEEVQGDAAALARLYRSKDMIERDFKVIKSEIELRPLYHRTDAKVRAHVAVCMLALLLKRALESRLRAAGRTMTADACLEQLKTCHLNCYDREQVLKSYYSITRPNQPQRTLLKALGMTALADDRAMADRIVPRNA